MLFLQDIVPPNIFEYLLSGSPWGISALFVFLYMQEKKYARDLTQKTTDLVIMISAFKDKIESQNAQFGDVTKMSVKIDELLKAAEEIKRLITK